MTGTQNLIPLLSRFARWTVISLAASTSRKVSYLCRCECGTERVVSAISLRRGQSRSCGCLKSEIQSRRMTESQTTHGLSKSPEYSIWKGIIKRCYNKNSAKFEYYGGRGIGMAPEWRHDFKAFLDHVGHRPSSEHSIDRIDFNKGYVPGNLRWATKSEQIENRRPHRRTVMVELDGVRRSLTDWGEVCGIPRDTIKSRLRKGWSAKDAVTRPLRRQQSRSLQESQV